jgi:hypothetical protein
MAASKESEENRDEQDRGERAGKHGDPLRDKIVEDD